MKIQPKQTKPYVNNRISGTPIYTRLSELPERFRLGPHTRVMSEYLARRWRAEEYGWFARSGPYGKSIAYNREFNPHEDADNLPRFRPDNRRFRWVEHPADGLRFVGKAHEIRGSGDGNLPYFDRALINHDGWYMDNFSDSDNLAWGEVYQLPADREGKSRYVPAICTSNDDRDGNDGAILDFHSVTDDLKDAVRWSDSMAERFAEDEREYQAKESAKARLEEITEEIKTLYADFKVLAKEIRANCERLSGMDAVKKLIRKEYRTVKAEVRKLRAEYRKVEENGLEY